MRTKTIALILLKLALATSAYTADKDSRFVADKTLVAWVSPANLTQQGGSVGVALFSNGGTASVTSLEAWEIEPANPF